jgi:hypothetical protein
MFSLWFRLTSRRTAAVELAHVEHADLLRCLTVLKNELAVSVEHHIHNVPRSLVGATQRRWNGAVFCSVLRVQAHPCASFSARAGLRQFEPQQVTVVLPRLLFCAACCPVLNSVN